MPTRPAGRAGPRIAAVLLAVGLALTVAQVPALAHPVGLEAPTNYLSKVTGIEGADQGVEARVVGGDAFLELTVPAGVEVEVPGYHAPEPYLRFEDGGDVHVNLAGPTHHYNRDRFADVLPRADVRADAEPRWDRVATGGRHAWLDHRIHWMNPNPPPRLDLDQPHHVRDWTVPLVVDGEPVTITGTLSWVPTPSPALPVALGLLVAAAGLARRSVRLSAVAVALGALGMAALVGAELGVPTEEPTSHVADLTAAGVALLLALRSTAAGLASRTRGLMLALSGASLTVVVVYQVGVVSMAVLPGWLPSVVGRPLVGAAAGAAIAGLVTGATLLVRSDDPTPAAPLAVDAAGTGEADPVGAPAGGASHTG